MHMLATRRAGIEAGIAVAIGEQDPMSQTPHSSTIREPRQVPPAAIVFRWASVILAAGLAIVQSGLSPFEIAAGILCGIAVGAAGSLVEHWGLDRDRAAPVAVGVQLAAISALVVWTGVWSSPFLALYFIPVLDAGFLLGLRPAFVAASVATLVPALTSITTGTADLADLRACALWTFTWMLAGTVSADTRAQASALVTWQRIVDAERREAELRLASIEDANTLLSELHEIAMTLPATLDSEGLVEATLDRVQELFPTKTAAVVACDESRFRILGARGAALPIVPIPRSDATAPLRIATERPVAAVHVERGSTLDPSARSLLYVPLQCEGTTVGVLALEDDDPERFGTDDIALLSGFAGPVAVSLENARLFSRLRALATSEERSRIARELHDRTAQHLAAIAFELDVLARRAAKALARMDADAGGAGLEVAATTTGGGDGGDGGDTGLISEIDSLSQEIRRAIEDLRITIGDLRTDVTDQKGLVELLREHAPAVAAKARMQVELELPPDGVRLPLPQERELWRICQEAIGNIVKHSGAGSFKVAFHVTRESADLRIEDNGCGFDPRISKPGHFGLTGMSERAEAIGAEFGLESSEDRGTLLTVSLKRRT